jgi:hypothetical protein
MNYMPEDSVAAKAPRYTRRVSDHILLAFHQACDQRDFETAELLLAALNMVVSPRRLIPGAKEQRAKESLVAAYGRLWQLRHPDPGEC